ncbi:ribonuclease Y [bacterium]|nr:ribonuclease Y [bacterium]
MELSAVSILCAVVFTFLGVFIGFFVKTRLLEKEITEAGSKSEEIIKEAHSKAEKIRNDAERKAKDKLQQSDNQVRKQLDDLKNRSKQQERFFAEEKFKVKQLITEQKELEKLNAQKEAETKLQLEKLTSREKQLEEVIAEEIQKLEKIGEFKKDEAKKFLLDKMQRQVKKESFEYFNQTREHALENADREAKRIISMAIQRLAADHTSDSSVSIVILPNERMRGAIIGKEGKNIKAFEDVTGVKIVFDEIPENVVLSCFDPVKREIAKIALESLIRKNNFNPKNIETVVAQATKSVEESVRKAAEDTLKLLEIKNVNKEMKENLGRLKYRTSYGQNVLNHSIEVATIAGLMAAEMGYDQTLARRAGLFHDVGKAATGTVEGSHITIGVDIAERAKEHPIVVNCILAHHDEAEPIHPIAILVTAADKISSSRPGARRDSVENYTKRIENLEKITEQFDGIKNVYAINAGREIRVIADAAQVSDLEANILSEEIATKIREQLQYGGQIKVIVIREKKVVQLTDTPPKILYDNLRNKAFEKALTEIPADL